jgi:hypothetical protein
MDFLNLLEVEDAARRHLDRQAYDYYSGGWCKGYAMCAAPCPYLSFRVAALLVQLYKAFMAV